MRHSNYITLFISLLAASASAEVSVTAFFEPARIKSNETSRYVIRIEESDTKAMPKLEPLKALTLQENTAGLKLSDGRLRRGASQQISINGARTYKDGFDLIIDAVAPRIGSYTIPSHKFEYKGETYTAPAATLTVVERTAPDHPENEHTVRLIVNAPEKLYVGQTTHITVKLYIYSSLDSIQYSQLKSSAPDFIFKSDDEKSFETTEYLQGWEYKVVNWPVEITPIKSGELPLNFEVIVSQTTGFGFFSRNQQRFPVYSEPTMINVASLPEAGKPKSFTGAIGDFTTEVFADQDEADQGEPIMLSLTIRGTGNFERISGPEFAESSEWRNYSPETFFEPNESLPLGGSKRFDYVFIPQRNGDLELPPVAFTYFDPKAEKYIELTSPPIPIKVTASAQTGSFIPRPSDAQSQTQILELKRTLTGEEALLMLDYQPKKSRTVKPTILQSPLFYVGNSMVLIAVIAGSIVTFRNRKLLNNEDYARSKEAGTALKLCLRNLESTTTRNEVSTFYQEAQKAIRLAATRRTGKDYGAATAADLENCFNELDLSDETIEASNRIFGNANAALFSSNTTTTDLRIEQATVTQILKAL